jgi:uncharacterized membrane protein YGL010W
MTVLAALLADYGGYHRDPRNRMTHYFGVPAIIYSVLIATALPSVTAFGVAIGIDRFIIALFVLLYLMLDIRLGLALAAVLSLLAWAAEATTRLGTQAALTLAGVIFVLGWALQLVGHHLEGNRPALLTNLFQVVVSPLYLAAEITFGLGLRSALHAEVQQRLGRSRVQK